MNLDEKNHAYLDDWYTLASTKGGCGGIRSTGCHSYINILFGSLRLLLTFHLFYLCCLLFCIAINAKCGYKQY